jgi:hypothetical protein
MTQNTKDAVPRAEVLRIIETYRVSVGNSAAGAIACEMTMANLKDIRDAVQALAPTAEQAEGVRAGERFVLDEVCDERIRQDKQWGGDKHDDEHGPIEWLGFIDYQADKAISETAGLQTDRSIAPYVRARLVKIAALAVAGMASIDRCFPDAASTGDQA